MKINTSLKIFKKNHSKRKHQILFRTQNCKHYYRVENLYKFILAKKNSFIFESVEKGAVKGRYTIIGLNPDKIWDINDNIITLDYKGKKTKIKTTPLKYLNKLINNFKIKVPRQLPSMASMLVGYFSYDIIRYIEKIPNKCVDDLKIPDVRLSRPKNLIIYDNLKNKIHYIENIYSDTKISNYDEEYYSIIKRFDDFESFTHIKLPEKITFQSYLSVIQKNIKYWKTDSDYQIKKNQQLLKDLGLFQEYFSQLNLNKFLWNTIYQWAEKNTKAECCEFIVSLMMEVYPEIVEPLSYEMSINEESYFDIDTSRTVEDVCNLIEKQYTWLLDINFNQKDNIFNFWYYSKNKQEPRMSDRFSEEGADLELPLAIARDIHHLYLELKTMEFGSDLGTYLLKNQLYRHVLRRVLICEKLPYSEIQDNTISKSLIPVDMLRLKLSFFGATRFDPRSDRWVRITMYQGAPLMKEIQNSDDTWSYKKIA